MYDRFVSAFLFRACELRKYIGSCVLLAWYVRNFCPVEPFHMLYDQVQIFDEAIILSLVFPLDLGRNELRISEDLYLTGA